MIRAVLFDVDGTLYHQTPLRAVMACELGVAWSRAPRSGGTRATTWRVLRAFRHVREELRQLGRSAAPLDDIQYARTAAQTGVDAAVVRAVVDDWIFTRPLRHIPRFQRAGVREAIEGLRASGIDAGVFSDYPTRTKVEACGLSDLFSIQVCATDPDVNAFKPHPRGFLRACERWGRPPDEVVYVGDRADVDAAGACAAGMHSVIIGRARATDGAGFVTVRTLHDLPAALDQLGRRGPLRPETVFET
jgi:HAD superfamily hydrolase (TIGR01509 family)